jgi:hypothetical protein
MDKAGALRKVMTLNKVAASATHTGEIEAAKRRATHLRIKFEIPDEDPAGDTSELNYYEFFGSKRPGCTRTFTFTSVPGVTPLCTPTCAKTLWSEL